MAPSHVSKQTIPVAQATSSRSGRRQVHNQHVEQCNETADENNEIIDLNEDQQIETYNDTGGSVAQVSQIATGSQLSDLLCNMVDGKKKRLKCRKQAVRQEYDEEHTQTQSAVISRFDQHEARASDAHAAQMDRLRDLLKRKAAIEAAMTEKLAVLRSDYIRHSKALEKATEMRVKETQP